MASEAGSKPLDLIDSISSNAAEFDFYQFVRLLERQGIKQQFSPSADISFPASDIKQAQWLENVLSIKLSFMGFYGVDSPLPQYFFTEALFDTENGKCLREFLNIFSQRIYTLLYAAWKKFQPVVQLEQGNADYLQLLRSISGNALTSNDQKEFAYAGLLGRRIKNAVGLATMLSSFLNGLKVDVQQFKEKWCRIETNAYLGGYADQALGLGDNTILGNQVVDRTKHIEIRIGPMTIEAAMQLLPGQEQHQRLNQLIKRYIGPLIEYELTYIVKPSVINGLQLGKSEIHLGWASWIGEKTAKEYEIRITNHTVGAQHAAPELV